MDFASLQLDPDHYRSISSRDLPSQEVPLLQWQIWELVACYRDLTKSCLSHSFRFPRLWTQHQEVMPKSCLLVFPHCERKRQNSPFQIGTFHFRFFFSSLPLRFNISYLPTFFPKQVYLYGVLNKNSVNRCWVAMALSHRKRPMQFVSSYSFEKVAVLGRIILLLPPGLHSWHALRLRSGCSGPPGYTMLYTCLPLVSTCVPLVSYSPACRVMCLLGFLPSCPFLPSFLVLFFFDPCLFFLSPICFFWSLFPHLPGEGC